MDIAFQIGAFSVFSLAVGYLAARLQVSRRLARHEARIERQEQEVSQLAADLEARSTEYKEAQLQLQELEKKAAVSDEQLSTARERLERQTAENRTLVERLEKEQEVRSERERTLSAAESNLQAGKEQAQRDEKRFEELKEELVAEVRKRETIEQARHEIAEELAQLKTSHAERDKHYREQLRQLEENKVALKSEFQNLANEILEAKGKAFANKSQESLNDLLKPFREQIDGFRKRVDEVHHHETQQQAAMRQELKQLQTMHQQMTAEAHNLATALRGEKKKQGNWGELILENALDRSGLRKGIDYEREVSVNTENGRSRPDAVVYLPDNRHLIIDAKVSLNAYTDYVNAEEEGVRAARLKEHVQSISDRIKELADRQYQDLPGFNSPDMVFMFIPIESAFVEALRGDETLFQKALEKNVLVATPTTLLTSLNIVRQLWRFENQNKHTAELADKAGKVYNKLRLFLESFEDIAKHLDKAKDAYSQSRDRLLDGRGNLIKQASEFKQLGVSVKDELPAHLVQKAELELSHREVTESAEPSEANSAT
ncbi:DNA recombination protein RmuC [Guyparkeria hydrothermalis]|uniref:DNA recombination protein RmuC n=1 Tax=Guyparkeria hydrothermalis TaxID=923 RepID=UPI0020219274|nr:DNA recombination protein RmuC [Guyparkeria hydrothermalis]MCL7744262.1 DNA recombination protein RmuC [Guyparkeria hydrothermalis]